MREPGSCGKEAWCSTLRGAPCRTIRRRSVNDSDLGPCRRCCCDDLVLRGCAGAGKKGTEPHVPNMASSVVVGTLPSASWSLPCLSHGERLLKVAVWTKLLGENVGNIPNRSARVISGQRDHKESVCLLYAFPSNVSVRTMWVIFNIYSICSSLVCY